MRRSRRASPIGLLLVFAPLALGGCHDLVNPVDPNSSTYTGEPTLADPADPQPILPPIERWETVAQHAPEQFLGLEIPEDGSLIDPRQPDDPKEFFVVITFEEPVYVDDFEEALVFVRVNDGSDVTTGIVSPEVNPIYRQAVIRTTPPEPPFFNATGDGTGGASIRIRVVDATGVVMGERLFGLLPGDFDGDGDVDPASDWTGGAALFDGVLADESQPNTIRADMDASGSVAAGSVDETIPSTRNNGTTLPPAPPPF
ncbi:MAG: hypothetical protein ACOC2D_15400 [Spirochaetota bacterium]